MSRGAHRTGGPLYLSLDQGGHASRALLFNQRGEAVSRGFVEVATHRIGDDRVEQDPEELVASIREAVDATISNLESRPSKIIAAGLATQRSSIVCWDKVTGSALSPVLSWQDRRAGQWLKSLSRFESYIYERTGLYLSPHYGASKLRWCLDHVTAVREAHQAGRLAYGPIASFLAFRLLEERPHVVDPANASRTLLWNRRTGDWDPELLKIFGLPREPLPRTTPTRHAFGHLKTAEERVPLLVLTGDQSAALFAFGEPASDTISINMGTGAFLQRPVGQEVDHPGKLLTSVVLQDGLKRMVVLEGTVNGAGSALTWLGRELGISQTEIEAHAPAWLARPSLSLLFLNGVSGLAAPYWVPDFHSRFTGGGEDWEKGVAVLESIVFLMSAIIHEMTERCGPAGKIRITGGLATLDGLCRRLADLAVLPVHRPLEREATARGTAYLAADYPSDWMQETAGVVFRPAANPSLQVRYNRWKEAMSAAVRES